MKKIQYTIKGPTLGALDKIVAALTEVDIIVSTISSSEHGAIIEISLPNNEEFLPEELILVGRIIGLVEVATVIT